MTSAPAAPSSPQSISGSILTPSGWVRGTVELDARITAVRGASVPSPGDEPIVLPGFIDLHVHGGGGADVMDAGGAIDTLARLHARHGTTSLLATTVTAPRPELERALTEVGPRLRLRAPGAARVLGVHLEGPFLNPGKLGAQPAFARAGTTEEVEALDALARVRVVTLAPELPGHLALIGALARAGITVQLGHTLATYDQAAAALEAGARGFTHLFNAMSGLDHRAPGAATAALALATHAEVIPDLVHVHEGPLRTALRAIPKLHCVTDACAAAGMPDGARTIFGRPAVKEAGAVRLEGGTLAGSALTMEQALRNLVSLGLPLADASRRVSTHAADYLGILDRGRIAPGAWADLVVLSPALELREVYVEGERISAEPRHPEPVT
jgi:N-acetylglucosamine-6-phosphate deacetylase